jgi:hypothetical protein
LLIVLNCEQPANIDTIELNEVVCVVGNVTVDKDVQLIKHDAIVVKLAETVAGNVSVFNELHAENVKFKFVNALIDVGIVTLVKDAQLRNVFNIVVTEFNADGNITEFNTEHPENAVANEVKPVIDVGISIVVNELQLRHILTIPVILF